MAGGRQRIDRWLFFARVVKSRSLAARFVLSGHVRINGRKADQASDAVRVGDTLTMARGDRILVYRVLAEGSRRGPADEARTLYEDLSPAPAAREPALDMTPTRDAGAGRPTKRDRRQIDRLQDG
jgi:ribosome-associated heat shock protein Hsp15